MDVCTGKKLATLGWELRRTMPPDDLTSGAGLASGESDRSSDGCSWLTHSITWHDFREAWRPGIGQEEWDRSFG